MTSLNESPINKPERSREEVMNEVRYIRQNIYLMGANDSEISKIDRLIKLEGEGGIGHEEVLDEVIKIQAGKQDYH